MFSGIVERTAKALRISEADGGLRLVLERAFRELSLGESISVDGVCLTVEDLDESTCTFFLSQETLRVTKFSRIELANHTFNLERALRPTSLIGGHIVLGHVDTIGRVAKLESLGKTKLMRIEHPEEFGKFIVKKGSVCIDGVSLTISELGKGWFEIVLVPYTIEHTNFKYLKVGDYVNIEYDVLAKYIQSILR